jgi:phospholipid N-methyltransferase
MQRFLKRNVLFYRQFQSAFASTGAIAPSGQFLARCMVHPLRSQIDAIVSAPNGEQPSAEPQPAPRSFRVLEVGPGTGAFTGEIIRVLHRAVSRSHGRIASVHLDAVELNPVFVSHLKERLATEKAWQRGAGWTHVHECAIEAFPASEPYDAVICGLPFNNFPAELAGSIFETMFRLLKSGCDLTYFEYVYLRNLRAKLGPPAERDRLRRLERVLKPYWTKYRVTRRNVLLNFPPAWVHHLRSGGGTPPVPSVAESPAAAT